MTMSEQTVVKKNKGISPVWTLPIIAVMICAWLLYKSFMEAGITIDVYFDDASGITPAKTQVIHMGIPLGIVKELHPDLAKGKVKATIRMDRTTEEYLVEDLKFWLVRPEVSADRITGLDTILSGSYIAVQLGKSQEEARTFTALVTAPPVPANAPGLHIKLRSTALRSIQEGSGIYFKNIKVGTVQSYTLEDDESILMSCHIIPRYSHLIHSKSRFYDASGVSISGKLTNLKVRMESLSSLFIGGIVVSTPEPFKDSVLAKNGDTFPLYEDYAASKYGISMTLKLASGKGITEGSTRVMYRGLEAGFVDHITINDDPERSVTAHILLDPRASLILRENTRFWMVSPDVSISGVNNISTMITGPYITFKPGDGDYRDDFEILPVAPIEVPLRPGKMFRLSSLETSPVSSGAPIYHRKIQIGEVIGTALADDRQSVETTIFIYADYSDLITPQSIFVETAGISLGASISGVSLTVDPLLAILRGGIDVITTPSDDMPGEESEENSLFPLYQDIEEALAAHPRLKAKGLYIKLKAANLDSYREGTPILYKKIKVGQVIGFRLSDKGENVQLTCFIDEKYSHLVNASSRFYNTSGIRLTAKSAGVTLETESLESIISGGISFFTPEAGKEPRENSTFKIHDSLAAAKYNDNSTVTVNFHNGEPLSEGSVVKYNGIQLGAVTKTVFSEDLTSVNATLSIEKKYQTFFRENTKIWLAQPKINLNGVKNLDTVLFGSYVTIQPGSGNIQHTFQGLDVPPPPVFLAKTGRNLVLEAKNLNSIEVGSPIYYRRVKIGEVTGYDLAFDFKDVLIYISIKERYAPIIRQNTRFWNASGVRVEGGLFSGINVSTQSLDSIMTGGISLATPEGEEMGPLAPAGYRFLLYQKPEPGWLDWSPDIFSIAEEEGMLPKWGL